MTIPAFPGKRYDHADFDGYGRADPAVMDSFGNLYIWISGSEYVLSVFLSLAITWLF